jgi:hypothetical protein
VLVVGGALCVVGLLVFARRQVWAPRGEELSCERIGFRVLDVATGERVGAPGSQRVARGPYRIVQLEVVNHGQDGDYDPAWHHALVIDGSGRVVPVDSDATEALRRAEGLPPGAALVAPGAKTVTPLVFDVPGDARDLTLRIALETAALLNLVDMVMHGDRRLLLDEAH